MGQFEMIQPEQMQHGCMKIIHVNWVLRDTPSEFIGFTVDLPAANSATGHP